MKKAGVIGLGNMGIGLANNIIKSGFSCTGFDLRAERLDMLEALGGQSAHSPREVGEHSDVILKDLGYTDDVISAIRDKGVI